MVGGNFRDREKKMIAQDDTMQNIQQEITIKEVKEHFRDRNKIGTISREDIMQHIRLLQVTISVDTFA